MTTWTTADEIQYVYEIKPHGDLSLVDMLRLYLAAAHRRYRWDATVDPAKVIQVAESRLRLAEMKEAA